MALVRLTTPALAAIKAHCSRAGTRPKTDEMLMMRPRLLLAHDPRGRLAHFVQAGQVHGDDPVPFFAGKLVDRHPVLRRVDAGIVDEDVEMPELVDDARDGRRRFGRGW